MNKPEEYKLYQAPDANTITFHSMNTGWVMRITAEGRFEVAEGADVTETARQVLDAMEGILGDRIKKAKLDEREACAREIDIPFYGEGGKECAAAIRARGNT